MRAIGAASRRRASPPACSALLAPLVDPLKRTPPLMFAAAGLCLGDALGGQMGMIGLAIVVLAGVAAAPLFLLTEQPAGKRLALALIAVAFGTAAAHRVYRPDLPADHLALAAMRRRVLVEGVLNEDPEPRATGARLSLRSERIDEGRGWRPVRGRLTLTVHEMRQRWTAGDRIRARLTLHRPRNFGNPGEFDYEGYLARRGVYVTAFSADDQTFELIGHTDGWLSGPLARWRQGIAALFERTLPQPAAAVLSALIVGTTALPESLRRAFSSAGVSHVLSISGLHVGLVAAAGYAVFRWLLARSRLLLLAANVPKLAAASSVVPVLLYAGIAGSNVATARSVIMILVFLGAVLVDRQRHLLVSLALAAIVLVLAAPGTTLDISFQLSFMAVLGLALGMARFWPWWKQWEEERLVRLRGWTARLWRPLAVYVAVSISALVATMPLTAFHFNQVSLVAPVANAVVVPLLGSVAVVLGLLAALAYPICQPLAVLFVMVAGPIVQLGIWLVECCAAIPHAALRVVTPTIFEMALMYAGALALVWLSGRARAASLVLLGLMVLGDGLWWYVDRYQRRDLRVTFLSVGQGDCAVVEFPGAEVMVIDGGGLGGDAFDVGERVIAPFLWSRKIAHVDYLLLSHPDWDHYGGLAFLAAHFSPREFWSNGAAVSSIRFATLERTLDERHVRRIVLQRGAMPRIGAVQMTVQGPPTEQAGMSDNDRSLVLSMAFAGQQLLFPGDIEAAAEDRLVTLSDGALESVVLKVPHHGSRTSSSTRLLDAVRPRLAVVSAGRDNRFGFPHPEVLRRYAGRACTIARTDIAGAIQVRISARGHISWQPHDADATQSPLTL